MTTATPSRRDAFLPSLVMDGAIKPMMMSGTQNDELAHDVLQGNDHPHETQREDLTQDNADHDAQQQPERQIVQ